MEGDALHMLAGSALVLRGTDVRNPDLTDSEYESNGGDNPAIAAVGAPLVEKIS